MGKSTNVRITDLNLENASLIVGPGWSELFDESFKQYNRTVPLAPLVDIVRLLRSIERSKHTDPKLIEMLKGEKERYKLLVSEMLESHPARRSFEDETLKSSEAFFSRFRLVAFYTFDLLPIWTFSQIKSDSFDDGFRAKGVFEGWSNKFHTQVLYPYGGIHIFEGEHGIEKLQRDPNKPIVDQFLDRVVVEEEPSFPVLVQDDFLRIQRILSSVYLHKCHIELNRQTGPVAVIGFKEFPRELLRQFVKPLDRREIYYETESGLPDLATQFSNVTPIRMERREIWREDVLQDVS